MAPSAPPGFPRTRRDLQTSAWRAHSLIRAGIRAGVIDQRDLLSEDRLIRAMDMTRASIREALQILAEEGLVERKRGAGTTVVRQLTQLPLSDLLPLAGRATTAPPLSSPLQATLLEFRIIPATEYMRDRLRIGDEPVLLREHLIEQRGEAVGVATGYFPLELMRSVAAGADPEYRLPVSVDPLDHAAIASVDANIEAVACDQRSARLLGVAEGSPILLRETMIHGPDGAPQMLSYGRYRGDRISMRAATITVTGAASPVPASPAAGPSSSDPRPAVG
jgi:GntR family transcriptional regulator